MIYKVLTLVVVNLLRSTMRQGEQVSVEKVFDLMGEHLSGLSDLRDWNTLKMDRRHVRMDPHKGRTSLATTWTQLIS